MIIAFVTKQNETYVQWHSNFPWNSNLSVGDPVAILSNNINQNEKLRKKQNNRMKTKTKINRCQKIYTNRPRNFSMSFYLYFILHWNKMLYVVSAIVQSFDKQNLCYIWSTEINWPNKIEFIHWAKENSI